MKMIRFLVLSMLLTQAAPAFAQDEEKKPEPAQEAKTEEAKPEEKQEKPQEKPAEEKPAEEKPAETPEATEAGLKVTTVLTGLNNPSGIAIQPETGTVFIADSGNLQVVKLVDGKAEPAIIEFPKDVYGKGPKVNIGPLGLAFLDKNTLVVGGGAAAGGRGRGGGRRGGRGRDAGGQRRLCGCGGWRADAEDGERRQLCGCGGRRAAAAPSIQTPGGVLAAGHRERERAVPGSVL